jgi:hypothetical protein
MTFFCLHYAAAFSTLGSLARLHIGIQIYGSIHDQKPVSFNLLSYLHFRIVPTTQPIYNARSLFICSGKSFSP